MKAKSSNFADVGFVFYIFTAIITVIFFFAGLAAEKHDEVPMPFADNWYTNKEMTEKANLKRPLENMSGNSSDRGSLVFYAEVPVTEPGDCLWFKSKNAFVRVKVGNDTRAEITEGVGYKMYGKTPGTDWVCVPLETADKSKLISIEFYPVYNDNSAYIDSVFVGNTVSSLRAAFADRIVGTVLCILLMFMSALLVIAYCMMNKQLRSTSKEILYLGLCVFFTALWSFSELRVFQIFTDKNAGVFHNLTCMTMMLMIMPIVYYFKNDLDKKSGLIVPVMTVVTILNFTVCSILHFTGILDFHETLTATHISIGLGAACILYANYLRCFKNPERTKADIAPAISMILISAAAVLDIFRYSGGGINDSSFYTRIALFFYAMALGTRSLTYVIDMAKRGVKSEIIARLAYEDGLTGLGNRTAYSEKLEKLADSPATIFIFDINNLKYVNDNLGHQAGDDLIKAGAEMISTVFGKDGECYRIGGDEFVCLIDGQADGELYSGDFYNKLEEFNASGALDFPLVVAMGYEYYSGSGSFEDTVDSADKKMYLKKAELKSSENGKYERKEYTSVPLVNEGDISFRANG